VRINAAGDDELVCRINCAVYIANDRGKVFADHCDGFAVNQEIGDVRINSSDDVSVLDECSHVFSSTKAHEASRRKAVKILAYFVDV
jgi:hypothetical protein